MYFTLKVPFVRKGVSLFFFFQDLKKISSKMAHVQWEFQENKSSNLQVRTLQIILLYSFLPSI